MTNITRTVQRFLDHDGAARRDLARGIINKRALAQHIKKATGLRTDTDAIISAIRRYDAGDKEEERFAKAGAIIRNATITTRTGIAIIALPKDAAVQADLPKLFSLIHYERGEVLRIVQAEETLKLIVDEKNVEKVVELVGSKKIIQTERHLAEINMQLAPVSAKVPGVLAILNNELADAGVNVVEEVSCVPEILWFVSNKELLRAHQTFIELIETLRNV